MIGKGTFINNRYELISVVGAGGMSDVYKAKDHKLNRNVAIKVLKREFSNDKNFVSKFRVEAQSAASLIHPNIVNVYDVGEDNGLYYIVMELIEGITLKKYIEKKGKLTVKETISIAIQIANGIECAHNNQIIHRDIKPQNIMISREGKVKVTDFGIARAASANTLSGTAMGSVHYISPEQANGHYVDEKSDIYSLGITMFEMLTGRVPFDGESTVSIAIKHIKENVPTVKTYVPNVPISLEKIILKCTQNKVDKRYPKISLLIADLKRALSEPDVDFVQIDQPEVGGSTIMITDDEINKIRKGSGHSEEVVTVNDDNDDIDQVSPKVENALSTGSIIVGIVALMIVSIIIVVVATSINFDSVESSNSIENVETIDQRQTVVPNVVGVSADEAESILKEHNLGYIYDKDKDQYSEIHPKDYILDQDIKAGEIVDKNTTIKLVMSKGPQRIQIPEKVEGQKLETVIADLEKIGLKYEITYEYSSQAIGTVINSVPAERTPVSKGDVVALTVSRGEEYSEHDVSTVPNVINKTEKKATKVLESAGYKVGEIKYEESSSVEKGLVIRQTIKSGSTAPKGASVGLVISKGLVRGKYTANYTFAIEDLIDAEGQNITEGAVSVLLDGVSQEVSGEYLDVSNWLAGQYTVTVYSNKKGRHTIELLVKGEIVVTDTVNLQ